MKLEFGGTDGKVSGTAESKPDGTIVFAGDGAEGIKGMVAFIAEDMANERQTDEITADEVLAYVLERMRGRLTWAEEVKEAADPPPDPKEAS